MSKKFTSDSPSIEEILAFRKPPTDEVTIQMDGTAAVRIRQLRDELKNAERVDARAGADLSGGTAEPIRRDLDKAAADARTSQVTFRLQARTRVVYEQLLRDHRAPKAQEEKVSYDVASFPAALVAACCVQPEMTLEQARQLLDELAPVEAATLFNRAVRLHEELTDIPFS